MTLPEIARQAALDAEHAWRKRVPQVDGSDPLGNAIAIAVAVAVLQEVRKDAQAREDRYLERNELAYAAAVAVIGESVDDLIAQFSPSTPDQNTVGAVDRT